MGVRKGGSKVLRCAVGMVGQGREAERGGEQESKELEQVSFKGRDPIIKS